MKIADLDLSTSCEAPFEFEYVDANGNPTGVLISVIGSHAASVKEWARKELNRMRQQSALNPNAVRTVEDDEAFGIKSAAVRIHSWKGISEECNYDNAVKLCSVNIRIREAVIKHSDNIANFT